MRLSVIGSEPNKWKEAHMHREHHHFSLLSDFVRHREAPITDYYSNQKNWIVFGVFFLCCSLVFFSIIGLRQLLSMYANSTGKWFPFEWKIISYQNVEFGLAQALETIFQLFVSATEKWMNVWWQRRATSDELSVEYVKYSLTWASGLSNYMETVFIPIKFAGKQKCFR